MFELRREYAREIGKPMPDFVITFVDRLLAEKKELEAEISRLKEVFLSHNMELKDGDKSVPELQSEIAKLKESVLEAVIESRNNYCPCCHARLDEICGPCKWCKDKDNHLDTERSMYKAWRKRAEEAEAEVTHLKETVGRYEAVVEAAKNLTKEYYDDGDWRPYFGYLKEAIRR